MLTYFRSGTLLRPGIGGVAVLPQCRGWLDYSQQQSVLLSHSAMLRPVAPFRLSHGLSVRGTVRVRPPPARLDQRRERHGGNERGGPI